MNEMTKWLKKNWLYLALTALGLFLIFIGVDSCRDDLDHRRAIKESDKKIAGLKKEIAESETRATTAIVWARTAETEAQTERAEKEKHKAAAVRIEEEKRELREKIAALPPTQVVIHTIEILKVEPEAISLQPQGVIFTLAAARINLEFLEEFTLVKTQYSEIQGALARSESSGRKLQEAGAKKDIAIAEKDGQLTKWLITETEWEKKFIRSEAMRKTARAKGRKEGGTIGGLVGFFLGLLLGK